TVSIKIKTRRVSVELKSVVQKLRGVEMQRLMTVKAIASTSHGKAFSRTRARSTAKSVAQESGMEINAGMGPPLRRVSRKEATSSAVMKPMLPLKVGRAIRNTTW